MGENDASRGKARAVSFGRRQKMATACVKRKERGGGGVKRCLSTPVKPHRLVVARPMHATSMGLLRVVRSTIKIQEAWELAMEEAGPLRRYMVER